MVTLALDAALSIGSVAVLDDSRVLAERETRMRDPDRERLLPTVMETIGAAGISLGEVERIVCGEGPGSFTSLRIAASIAKGLAVGRGISLYAVSSLLLQVVGGARRREPGRYLSAMDAMRGESFTAGYALMADGSVDQIAPPAVGPTVELPSLASTLGARLIGPGMPIDASPRADGVARLERWLHERGAVDVSSWEPLYGRFAEAQVKWEAAHGRPLDAR